MCWADDTTSRERLIALSSLSLRDERDGIVETALVCWPAAGQQWYFPICSWMMAQMDGAVGRTVGLIATPGSDGEEPKSEFVLAVPATGKNVDIDGVC